MFQLALAVIALSCLSHADHVPDQPDDSVENIQLHKSIHKFNNNYYPNYRRMPQEPNIDKELPESDKQMSNDFDNQPLQDGVDKMAAALNDTAMLLNKGIKKVLNQNNIKSPDLDKFISPVLDYLKKNIGPNFRAASKYGIRPEIVQFKSNKPTLKFEMNPYTVMGFINNFLRSDNFNKSVDNMVKQAGVILRTLKERNNN